jgi:hypothetical protein
MDPLDVALRFGAIAVAATSLGWNFVQYRLGARKAELAEVKGQIAKVAADLDAHKEAGQTSRAELSERLGNVEVALQHMPDKDTVHRLEVAVAEVRGDVRAQSEAVRGLADNVRTVAASGERIESYLLQAKK